MTGIEMTHIPYKGSAPALTDVIAGHVPLMFSDTVPSLPQIKEGRVRALGVSTAIRLPSAPDIPPIAEVGVPGFDAAGWGVFSVPTGTPKEVVAKLQTALASVMALPDVQQQIIKLGMIPGAAASPAELKRFIDSEIARWGKGRDPGGIGGDGVRLAVTNRHKNRVGHINVRHMCDDGVLSKPKPSFGCLKWRPMMSVKSSRLTTALGSNE
jgi:Tripartite tricarboxylate transporter family receptor